MKLAQIFKDFEEQLITQGEEAESLSFVYRSLKTSLLQTLFLLSSKKSLQRRKSL